MNRTKVVLIGAASAIGGAAAMFVTVVLVLGQNPDRGKNCV